MSGKQVINYFLMLVSILCVGFVLFLSFYFEIRNPESWKPNVKRAINPASGLIKVQDAESNKILFYYLEEGATYPIEVNKISEDEWRVTFKKHPN